MEGKLAANGTYTLRTLIKLVIEVREELYFCVIYNTKAFDRERHDEIIAKIAQLKLDGKHLKALKENQHIILDNRNQQCMCMMRSALSSTIKIEPQQNENNFNRQAHFRSNMSSRT